MFELFKIKTKKGLLFFTIVFTLSLCSKVMSATVDIVTEHLAPFQIVNGRTITGLSTEIIQATMKEANLTYSLEAHAWSLSYNSALKEKNTCIYSLAHLPQREALFQWIGHITQSTTSLYALKSHPVSIKNLEDAKRYKIAVIKDDVTHHFLISKGFIENENLYVMNNYDALLKLLEIPSRQIDLVVMNDDLLNNRLDNAEEVSKYKNVYLFKDFTMDFYFACSLNTDKTIVSSLIQAMKNLEKSGDFSAIRNKWQKNMVNVI